MTKGSRAPVFREELFTISRDNVVESPSHTVQLYNFIAIIVSNYSVPPTSRASCRVHYITLHDTTVHLITLHDTTLLCTTVHLHMTLPHVATHHFTPHTLPHSSHTHRRSAQAYPRPHTGTVHRGPESESRVSHSWGCHRIRGRERGEQLFGGS